MNIAVHKEISVKGKINRNKPGSERGVPIIIRTFAVNIIS
jgi:hypothetical protein